MANRYSKLFWDVKEIIGIKDKDSWDPLFAIMERISKEQLLDHNKDYEMMKLNAKINRQRKELAKQYEQIKELKAKLWWSEEYIKRNCGGGK